MLIFDLVGDDESHPAYQAMAAENLGRQYDLIQSLVDSAIALQRPLISHELIKALNYHAIACLHSSAGEYRPSQVQVGQGPNAYHPPNHDRVPAMMNAFVDEVNRFWDRHDPVALAAYVLWKLCAIHPFVNGNGRTARAACYYVLCSKNGVWLPGQTTVPELIRANHQPYVAALKAADASVKSGALDLTALHQYLQGLLAQQLASAQSPTNGP